MADVLVDGTSVGAGLSFHLTSVDANHAITAVFAAKVKPALGMPKNPTSVKKSRAFTVSGSIVSGSSGAPSVKLKAYKLKGKKWVAYKYFSATATGAKYSAKIKITVTGKFRFKAYSTASATHLVSSSRTGKTLTVKN